MVRRRRRHVRWRSAQTVAQTVAYVCRNEIHEITMQCRGAKSFVDDLGLSRGVVPSRAAAILRSIETKPFDSVICPLDGRTHYRNGTSKTTCLSAPLERLSPLRHRVPSRSTTCRRRVRCVRTYARWCLSDSMTD